MFSFLWAHERACHTPVARRLASARVSSGLASAANRACARCCVGCCDGASCVARCADCWPGRCEPCISRRRRRGRGRRGRPARHQLVRLTRVKPAPGRRSRRGRGPGRGRPRPRPRGARTPCVASALARARGFSPPQCILTSGWMFAITLHCAFETAHGELSAAAQQRASGTARRCAGCPAPLPPAPPRPTPTPFRAHPAHGGGACAVAAARAAGMPRKRVELAASGRARCRSCGSNIARGSVRVGTEVRSATGSTLCEFPPLPHPTPPRAPTQTRAHA